MPRFAANLSTLFNEVDFPQRFAAAARAGFEAVEFQFPYAFAREDVARWLNDSALSNVMFNMPPGDWPAGERGMAALPGREDEFRAGVDTALGYADLLGTSRLHAMAGIVPADAERSHHMAVYEGNLRYAAGRLQARNITLLIEPINGRDMPGYFLQTQAEAHAICARVGASNLKVQMDLYHAQIMGGDLSTLIRGSIAQVGHVQIAGVPDRHEPDQGEVNFSHLFALLDELGYSGWIGCEYRPRGMTEDGLQWLRDVRANAAKQDTGTS